ncbi:hypothetical protein E2C01_036366 [Portunus trituberculatus]|uniref:Uncharacterized protein n=1 Tax=Portunus trituberculatus TaxID=210409 RepID=A0A5B7FBQ3_PORTR|nr:hypothetical protein [Portunus trituberculatus]
MVREQSVSEYETEFRMRRTLYKQPGKCTAILEAALYTHEAADTVHYRIRARPGLYARVAPSPSPLFKVASPALPQFKGSRCHTLGTCTTPPNKQRGRGVPSATANNERHKYKSGCDQIQEGAMERPRPWRDSTTTTATSTATSTSTSTSSTRVLSVTSHGA